MGLEPTISPLGGVRRIHWATRAGTILYGTTTCANLIFFLENGKKSLEQSKTDSIGEVQMSIRDQAKLYFQKGKYVAAAEAYTEAITLEPDNASLYCNRALCNQKLNKWQNVVGDAGEKQTKTFPPPKSPVPLRPMRSSAVAHISFLRLLPPNQVEHASEKLEH